MKTKSKKSFIILGVCALIIACLTFTVVFGFGAQKAYADTNVSSSYNEGYTLIDTKDVKSETKNHEYYVVTYKIYASNAIYHKTGVAMVIAPTTYYANATAHPTITQAEITGKSFTVTESLTQSISEKIGSEVSSNASIGFDGLSAGLGSKVNTEINKSFSRTYSASVTESYQISLSSTTPITEPYNGYYGFMIKSEDSKHVVIKMRVKKYTEQKNSAGTYNGNYSESTIVSEKEVYSNMVPYYPKGTPRYTNEIKVWTSASAYYDELDNTTLIREIEKNQANQNSGTSAGVSSLISYLLKLLGLK